MHWKQLLGGDSDEEILPLWSDSHGSWLASFSIDCDQDTSRTSIRHEPSTILGRHDGFPETNGHRIGASFLCRPRVSVVVLLLCHLEEEVSVTWQFFKNGAHERNAFAKSARSALRSAQSHLVQSVSESKPGKPEVIVGRGSSCGIGDRHISGKRRQFHRSMQHHLIH